MRLVAQYQVLCMQGKKIQWRIDLKSNIIPNNSIQLRLDKVESHHRLVILTFRSPQLSKTYSHHTNQTEIKCTRSMKITQYQQLVINLQVDQALKELIQITRSTLAEPMKIMPSEISIVHNIQLILIIMYHLSLVDRSQILIFRISRLRGRVALSLFHLAEFQCHQLQPVTHLQ